MLDDLRFALRSLRKHPGFAWAAILILIGGITGATFIFSFVNAWVLNPAPFANVEELVYLRTVLPSGAARGVSPADWADISLPALGELGAFTQQSYSLRDGDSVERVSGMRVAVPFFEVLRVNPVLGRTFSAREGVHGQHHVAMISFDTWKNRFNGDPKILGKVIRLTGEDFVVVGVIPDSFVFVPVGRTEIVTPLALTEAERRDRAGRYLSIVGRLRGGASLQEANAGLRQLSRDLERLNPDSNRQMVITAEPYADEVAVHTGRPILLTLFAVSVAMLWIACSNVANLLLARVFDRQRLTAIQLSLGATPGRVIRQALIETLAVFLIAGLLSVLAAAWLSDLLTRMLPEESLQYLPNRGQAPVDGTVMAFSLAMAAVTALLFGVAPALGSARVSLSGVLKEAGSALSQSRSRGRSQRGLVIAQVMIATALLVSTGMLIKNFRAIWEVPAGFDTRDLTTFAIHLDPKAYPDAATRRAFFRRAYEALDGTAAIANVMPFGYETAGASFTAPGRERRNGLFHAVFPGYFKTMGAPLLRGREFSLADREDSAPVVIINEGLAKREYGAADPLGKEILLRRAGIEARHVIVGVSANIRSNYGADITASAVYVPFAQFPGPNAVFAMRGPGLPVAEVRRRIAAIDPGQPVWRVRTMREWMRAQSAGYELTGYMLWGFGFVALVIAAAGLYSVVAFAAIRRTREFGIRSALGASRADILRHVAAGAARLALFGIIPGLIASIGAGKLLAGAIPGLSTVDASVYPPVIGLLAVAIGAAAIGPALRAARVDPLRALRHE